MAPVVFPPYLSFLSRRTTRTTYQWKLPPWLLFWVQKETQLSISTTNHVLSNDGDPSTTHACQNCQPLHSVSHLFLNASGTETICNHDCLDGILLYHTLVVSFCVVLSRHNNLPAITRVVADRIPSSTIDVGEELSIPTFSFRTIKKCNFLLCLYFWTWS
jgi:hypothetical protein